MNFNNINDFEFEVLAKDILEKETGKKYRVFAPGRDGGIDVTSYEAKDTFAQAKLYNKSSISTLITNLKNELEKVKVQNPNEYYIFTSRELSKEKIDELYDHFRGYMSSADNIYDGTRISDLLQSEDYTDVLRKHYKLWLVSTEVLALTLNQCVFIDTEDLMIDIKQDSKLYVKTTHHNMAHKILHNENVLIIEGNPGVGKTMLSKMLLLDYASNNYRIRYASNNSISDIKNSLSLNKDLKEIILLDDFLGQHYLDATSQRTNELKSLIQLVIRSEHKKLILNSRVTILNEAQSKFQQFDSLIKDRNISKLMLSLSGISNYEKAMIFYNHLFFSNLPTAYFQNIREGQRYNKIIAHKNYNPRIIEFISKPYNYSLVNSSEYYTYILGKLDNPEDVWKDEFDNRIELLDRIMMLCLYSLTEHQININYLKCAYEHWILKLDVDLTKDNFEESIKRLNKSMIKIIINDKERFISVTNPSVNDFLYNRLYSSVPLLISVLKNSYYYEQLERLNIIYNEISTHNIVNAFIISKIHDLSLLDLNTFDKNINYYFVSLLEKNNVLELKLKDVIFEAYYNNETYKNLTSPFVVYRIYNKLFDMFIQNSAFCEFYSLYEILFDEEFIKNFVRFIDIESIKKFNAFLTKNEEKFYEFNSDWDMYIDVCTTAVNNQLSELYDALLWDEANDMIDEYVKDNMSEFDEHEIMNSTRLGIKDWLNDRVYELNEEFEECLFYSKVEVDLVSIIENLDILTVIDNFKKEMYEEDRYDEWRDEILTSSSSNDYSNEINQMFDRNWDI